MRGIYLSYKVKSLEKLNKNKVKLDLEITNNYFRKSINKAYKNISQKANIPGFRKGKIPHQLIDANFGKQYVLNEAASISISELYPHIINSANLKPIDYPKVNITQLKEDLPLGFEITIDVEPQAELPSYKGIEVTGLSTEVTDEEIEKQIENIRNRFATLEPASEDKAVVEGDYVTVDFDGRVEGKEFEGGKVEDYVLEVGSKVLFEELEKSLIGMKQGETKNVLVTLPHNIEDKNLAGKQAEYTVTLKEIKRKVVPELTEEFLKNIGDYKDVDEFKNYIKEKLVEQKKKIRRAKIIEDIFNYLLEHTKVDIPPVMIDNRVSQIKEDFKNALKSQKISKETYLKSLNITEEKLEEEIKQRAVREVKEYLIITALEKAEKNNIEPSDEEIKETKKAVLDNYQDKKDREKVKEFIESPEGEGDLISSIRRKKIFDFLVENAKIVEEKDRHTANKTGKKIWVPKQENVKDRGESKKLWIPNSKNKK